MVLACCRSMVLFASRSLRCRCLATSLQRVCVGMKERRQEQSGAAKALNKFNSETHHSARVETGTNILSCGLLLLQRHFWRALRCGLMLSKVEDRRVMIGSRSTRWRSCRLCAAFLTLMATHLHCIHRFSFRSLAYQDVSRC